MIRRSEDKEIPGPYLCLSQKLSQAHELQGNRPVDCKSTPKGVVPMAKVYRDEVTTRGGHDVEVRVVEEHPNYELLVDAQDSDCEWKEKFVIDPRKRANGDTEVVANALIKMGRRWALLHCT